MEDFFAQVQDGVEFGWVASCAYCHKPDAIPEIVGEWDRPTGTFVYGICRACADKVERMSPADQDRATRRIERYLEKKIPEAVRHPATWGPCHQCGRLLIIAYCDWHEMVVSGMVAVVCRCGFSRTIELDPVGGRLTIRDQAGRIH